MSKRSIVLGVAVLAVLLATTSAFAQNHGVSFTSIGFIDPPGNFPASAIIAMNPEGTEFIASPSFTLSYCVKWTQEGGWGELIGSSSNLCRISSQGTVMSNGLYPGQTYAWPGTWTGVTDEWIPIAPNPGYAPCGGSRMSWFDMGGDGDYATGLTWAGCSLATGFLWEKATDTSISLGTPNGRSTRGNAVTTDGRVVVGFGTMVTGSRRGARWENGSWAFLGDPNGEEPKVCAQSGGFCNSNSGSTSTGCPEYVDDGSCTDRGTCQNTGTCVSNVCVGGVNAGNSCTSNSQCPGSCVGGTNPGTNCTNNNACAGTCTGPNAGATCTSNSTCPDTLVCVPNPDWSDDLMKGEAYDVTDDGQYACGRTFAQGSADGYRANPDGSFTAIPTLPSFPDFVDPFRISQDGKTIVGRIGNPFRGALPFFWNEQMGTVDLQIFLVSQGLDELFFWRLTDLYDVSADGKVMGGRGFNPDGKYEGFVVDISKVWICHAPPGNPEKARTLGISSDSVGDHLAHGDFLGTCEFLNSGGLSRSQELRERLNAISAQDGILPDPFVTDDSAHPRFGGVSADIAPTGQRIREIGKAR